MSKIKNDGLDQYGAKPFEQKQFVTAGDHWVNPTVSNFDRFCKQCLQTVSASGGPWTSMGDFRLPDPLNYSPQIKVTLAATAEIGQPTDNGDGSIRAHRKPSKRESIRRAG